MRAVHLPGEICERQDKDLSENLYLSGVLPDGEQENDTLCLESDGIWFSVQNPPENAPKRLEIKALVAYAGKEIHGRKTSHINTVHHVMVAKLHQFLPEVVAVIGTQYNLSKIKKMHVGSDGKRGNLELGLTFPRQNQ